MQPDLDNVKNKIQGSKDLVDKITNKIPGFGDYVAKAEMYEADRLIRGQIADTMLEYKKLVDETSSVFVKESKLDLLSDLEGLNTDLERLHKKIKFADYGTSGGNSSMKISDEDKNKLLEYDWRLISSADEIQPLFEGLTGEDFSGAFKVLKDKIKEFEKSFNDRKNVLMEVI